MEQGSSAVRGGGTWPEEFLLGGVCVCSCLPESAGGDGGCQIQAEAGGGDLGCRWRQWLQLGLGCSCLLLQVEAGTADGCCSMKAEFRSVVGCSRLLVEDGMGHFTGCRWRCVCSCLPASAGGAWCSSWVVKAAGRGWRWQIATEGWRQRSDLQLNERGFRWYMAESGG